MAEILEQNMDMDSELVRFTDLKKRFSAEYEKFLSDRESYSRKKFQELDVKYDEVISEKKNSIMDYLDCISRMEGSLEDLNIRAILQKECIYIEFRKLISRLQN